MLLADFHEANEAARWTSTDDVVMGGQSSSAMLAGDGVGIFAGELSLKGGGGFASVRRREQVVDLSACDAIELHLRGDKRYKINLRTSDGVSPVILCREARTLAELKRDAVAALFGILEIELPLRRSSTFGMSGNQPVAGSNRTTARSSRRIADRSARMSIVRISITGLSASPGMC